MKFSLKRLLLGGIIIMLSLFAILFFTGIAGINNLSSIVDEMEVEYQELMVIQSLHFSFQQLVWAENEFQENRTPENINNFNNQFFKTRQMIIKAKKVLSKNHRLILVNKFNMDVLNMKSQTKKIITTNHPIDSVILKSYLKEITAITEKANQKLESLLSETQDETIRYLNKKHVTKTESKRKMLIIGIIASFFSLLGGFIYFSKINRSLNQLTFATKKIGTGSFISKLKTTNNDEFGNLFSSFNRMIDSLDKKTLPMDCFNNIFMKMVDSYIITDADTKIISINKDTLIKLGYLEDEIIGKPFETLTDENFNSGGSIKDNTIKQYFNENEYFHNIYSNFFSHEGEKIPILLSGSIIKNPDDSIKGMIFIANHRSKYNSEDNSHEKSRVKSEIKFNYLSGSPLTIREKEVLKLLAEEYNNKEIAQKLFISIRTVETHRKNIMQKLHAKTIIGLIKYAFLNGII